MNPDERHKRLEDEIIDFSKQYGWEVENLDDNPSWLRVKGQNWIARHHAMKPIYGWTRAEVAAELAHLLLTGNPPL